VPGGTVSKTVAAREWRVPVAMSDSPHDHDRIAGYLAAMSTFATLAVAGTALGRSRGAALPDGYRAQDLVLGALATHKVARIVSKDGVTTPLRAPFTEFRGVAGSAEVNESARPEPVRHVVGELLTCPFCLAPWIASAYVGTLVVAPRVARTWAAVFRVVAGADLMQHLYARVRTD
jgi:hypothetical protein